MDESFITDAISVLGATPGRLSALFQSITSPLQTVSPGPEEFSPVDVLAHLIHGEVDDWVPRLRLMLDHEGPGLPEFSPFDRFAHRKLVRRHSVKELLSEFSERRAANLQVLRSIEFDDDTLTIEAIHPSLGRVTVLQLLNTWVAHDLSHLNQVNRALITRFSHVGPWREYIRILNWEKQ